MEERKWCIYKHTSPSNKVYIGITCQKPTNRWRKNGQGYKSCVVFNNAIQKYGWNNFKHEILETNLTQDEACILEIKYIKKYNSQVPYGYNVDKGGYSGSVFEKSIYMISKKGIIKKEFDSISKAAFYLNCDPSSISHSLINGTGCKNYLFAYKDEIDTGIKKIENIISEYRSYTVPVYQYDFKTHELIAKYKSITEASIHTNTRRTNISQCLSGRSKSANGYIWSDEKVVDFSKYEHISRKKEKPKKENKKVKPICKYDLKWNLLKKYKSISEASMELTGKNHSSTISSALKNPNKTAYGFKWLNEGEEYKAEEYKCQIFKECEYDSILKENSVPICQYSLDGEFIKKYISFSSASKQTGILVTSIRRVSMQDKHQHAGGFMWRVEGDDEPIIYYGNGYTQRKAIIQLSKNGKFISKYESVNDAARKNNLRQSNISACLVGKTKSCGGYIWRYAD